MKSEKEKMLSGELYDSADPELVKERRRAHAACRRFNAIEKLSKRDKMVFCELFGRSGRGCAVEPPFFCDYGSNILLGKGVYFNFNATILDCAEVEIGDFAKFGPGVQIYTAGHPLDPSVRQSGLEFALPVRISDNAWIGGATVILPGVAVGKNAVIGAGSVVSRNVPDGAVYAGNPARPVKRRED